MAQKVQLIDDLDVADNTPAPADAIGTVTFSYSINGASVHREIDLSEKHTDEFEEALGPYVQAGREVARPRHTTTGGAARRRAPRGNTQEIRVWARQQGIQVSDRGRVPADVIAKYEAAH